MGLAESGAMSKEGNRAPWERRPVRAGRHDVRDVTRGEDGCRVRKGSAPQVLAAVRNAVIHLLAGVEATSNAAALRRLNNHPEEALALLDLPQLQ